MINSYPNKYFWVLFVAIISGITFALWGKKLKTETSNPPVAVRFKILSVQYTPPSFFRKEHWNFTAVTEDNRLANGCSELMIESGQIWNEESIRPC